MCRECSDPGSGNASGRKQRFIKTGEPRSLEGMGYELHKLRGLCKGLEACVVVVKSVSHV